MQRITPNVEPKHIELIEERKESQEGIDSDAAAVRSLLDDAARAEQLEAKLEQVRTAHESELEQVRSECESKVEQVEAEYEAKLEELQATVEGLRTDREEKIRLETQVGQLKDDLERVREERDSAQARYNEAQGKLKVHHSERNGALARVKAWFS